MCKQRLNTFAIATGSFERFGLGQCPRHVTGLLVEAALDYGQRRLWTALRLEETAAAIAGALEQLNRAGLIFSWGEPPDCTYTFKHALAAGCLRYEALQRARVARKGT
jgi:hypothetical protein